MDEDLFDFSGGQAAIASSSTSAAHKRKGISRNEVVVPQHSDAMEEDAADDEEGNGGPSDRSPVKRPRTGSPRPMIVDEFETTEITELPANGGLTASSDAEALKPLTWAKKVRSPQYALIKY